MWHWGSKELRVLIAVRRNLKLSKTHRTNKSNVRTCFSLSLIMLISSADSCQISEEAALTSASRSWCSPALAGHVPSSAGSLLRCCLHPILRRNKRKHPSHNSYVRVQNLIEKYVTLTFYSPKKSETFWSTVTFR